MKVAIVVGHNKDRGGSYSAFLNDNEFGFFCKVADYIKEMLEGIDVFWREECGSYSREMKKVIDAVNAGGYDLAIELHYNAYNSEANGVEMLHYHTSKKGIEYSEELIRLHEKLGLKKRRLIPIKDNSHNGSYGIMNSKMPYILTESFFGDNASDCQKVSVEKIGDIFVEFLIGLGAPVRHESMPADDWSIEKSLKVIETEIEKIRRSL